MTTLFLGKSPEATRNGRGSDEATERALKQCQLECQLECELHRPRTAHLVERTQHSQALRQRARRLAESASVLWRGRCRRQTVIRLDLAKVRMIEDIERLSPELQL